MIDGLRWVETTINDPHVVRGMVPIDWPGTNATWYKLQWLDSSGYWRDVEIQS